MSDLVTPEQAALLEQIIRSRQARIFTHLPGRIEKYDASTQLADIKPLVNNKLETQDGVETVDLPVISNVPIMFPRGGGYFISFPLAVGDTVELHFSMRSLDLWLERGGVIDPVLLHQHDPSDATAELGLYAKPDKLTSASSSKLVIGKDGDASMQITIDGSVIKLSDNATDFVALASKVMTELGKIATAINTATYVNAAGTPTVLVFPGGNYSASSVSATKVKAQ